MEGWWALEPGDLLVLGQFIFVGSLLTAFILHTPLMQKESCLERWVAGGLLSLVFGLLATLGVFPTGSVAKIINTFLIMIIGSALISYVFYYGIRHFRSILPKPAETKD